MVKIEAISVYQITPKNRHGSSSSIVAKIFSYKKDDIMSGHGKLIPVSHLRIALHKTIN